jgi:hypothetical protein
MKTRFLIPVLLVLLAFAVSGSDCLLYNKVLDVVYVHSTCVDFVQAEDSEEFTTPEVVDYADEIDQILDDNDISKSDIVAAHVVSASYEVTDFSQAHDWIISGEITVRRTDVSGPTATIVEYTSQSVEAALGVRTPAVLVQEGVDLLNDALDDYLDGGMPVLEFTVVSSTGDVEPDPSPQDVMEFEWRACIAFHIVATVTTDAPDPFGGYDVEP